MTEYIVELRDQDVRIHNRDEVLVASPGFASIAHAKPVFGHQARQEFRLLPRQSFYQFWSQLSLDPLANTNNYFRHQADLAYGHLASLAEAAGLDSDAIFVVPGNYTRNQLAILLGLVRQLPFEASGLVDMAVAATAGSATADIVLYLDVQLHQSVVTRLSLQDGRLSRESVLQIPAAGLLPLHDAWVSMITDAFIKQARFDPLHDAETEQYLYNQIDHWIEEARTSNEVLLEINHQGTIHQAQVNRGYFELKARGIFTRIKEELETIGSGEVEIFVPAGIAALPGLRHYIPDAVDLDEDLVRTNCFSLLEHIKGDPESLNLVTSLPAGAGRAPKAAARGREEAGQPSHILVNDKAYPLPAHMLYLGPRPATVPGGNGVSFIEVDDPGLDRLITITRRDQGYVLEKSDNETLRVNGQAPEDARPLALGDRIGVVNSPVHIQLIQVE